MDNQKENVKLIEKVLDMAKAKPHRPWRTGGILVKTGGEPQRIGKGQAGQTDRSFWQGW